MNKRGQGFKFQSGLTEWLNGFSVTNEQQKYGVQIPPKSCFSFFSWNAFFWNISSHNSQALRKAHSIFGRHPSYIILKWYAYRVLLPPLLLLLAAAALCVAILLLLMCGSMCSYTVVVFAAAAVLLLLAPVCCCSSSCVGWPNFVLVRWIRSQGFLSLHSNAI